MMHGYGWHFITIDFLQCQGVSVWVRMDDTPDTHFSTRDDCCFKKLATPFMPVNDIESVP